MGSRKIVRRFSEDSVGFNWIDLRFFRVRRDLLGLFGIFWDYLGFLESFGIFWDSVRSSEDFQRILLNSIGLFEILRVHRDYLGSSMIFWDLSGSFGIFWDLLGSFLDLLGFYKIVTRFSEDSIGLFEIFVGSPVSSGIFLDLLGFCKLIRRFSRDSIGFIWIVLRFLRIRRDFPGFI